MQGILAFGIILGVMVIQGIAQSSSTLMPSFSSSPSSSSSFSPTSSSSYANSSPTSSESTISSEGGSTPFSTTSASDSESSVEKLVTYTTKQKTIFIACCGGTFVILIALAILSGLSDTIARSRQKTKRTHA